MRDGLPHGIVSGYGYTFSEGAMGFVALMSRDRSVRSLVQRAAGPAHAVASTPSWPALVRLVRERPATTALLELDGLSHGGCAEGRLLALRDLFPYLPVVLLARTPGDPVLLFRLGRAGVRDLFLLQVDDLDRELPRALVRVGARGTTSTVLRALSPEVSRRELMAVRIALDGVHHRWGADQYAAQLDLSRPHLSELLKGVGLPSAGHLLVWVRLLHAGRWLEEPGRTGESVSRQLEYSSGAAFRRALRTYTRATPTEVASRGGLDFVLDRFMAACGYRTREVQPLRASVA